MEDHKTHLDHLSFANFKNLPLQSFYCEGFFKSPSIYCPPTSTTVSNIIGLLLYRRLITTTFIFKAVSWPLALGLELSKKLQTPL